MKSTIEQYIDRTVNRIEREVVIEETDKDRLRTDLLSEIENRLGSEPTQEQIERELGSPLDWARNFLENSEFLKAEYSKNYLNERTEKEFFGYPLLHVTRGLKNGKPQTARGIIAVSDYQAVGVFSLGGFAYGIFAFGGFSIGLFSCGGFALGLIFALGGFALAGISLGGFAAGIIAHGGFAIGALAVGGFAIGYYAFGGLALGYVAVGGNVHGIYGKGNMQEVRHILEDSHFLVRMSDFMQTSDSTQIAFFPIALNIAVFLSVAFFLFLAFSLFRWAGQRKIHRNGNDTER